MNILVCLVGAETIRGEKLGGNRETHTVTHKATTIIFEHAPRINNNNNEKSTEVQTLGTI